MVYVLNNKDGAHLRGFYPNDITGVFSFSYSSYEIYQTETEAKERIEYIQKQVNDTDNQNRYGHKWATTHRRIANQLTIGEA